MTSYEVDRVTELNSVFKSIKLVALKSTKFKPQGRLERIVQPKGLITVMPPEGHFRVSAWQQRPLWSWFPVNEAQCH